MKLTKAFSTPGPEHYFFGYYDKSPLDVRSIRLLAQRTSFINRMPKLGESIEIGWFSFPHGTTFHPFAHSSAWNWQQGCMLQWLGPTFDRYVIYNDIRDGQFISVVHDTRLSSERILPMSIYTVSSDGKWGLCIDYERHYWFRAGYNYQGPPNLAKNKPIYPEDGIWRLSLETGELIRIISLEQVMNAGRLSAMESGAHYLEHLMINPANSRFCFLHRWQNVDGGIYARLFSANIDGSKLCLLNNSGRMSHFCWRDPEVIFGWGGVETPFNRLRGYHRIARHLIKPLLPLYHSIVPDAGAVARKITGDGYLLFRDQSRDIRRVFHKKLPEDGHPSFRPGNRDVLVSDTYPDNVGDCQLYLFDIERHEVAFQTRINTDAGVRATGYRCDLHPKWSFDGLFVSIDRVTEEGRSIEVFAVDE